MILAIISSLVPASVTMDWSLPLTNPVVVFMSVLTIILLAPPLMQRIKVPGLVGLIVSGMLVGPNGFNILQRNSSIILFGTVGILYIMFLAGLELDRHDFQRNRNKSLLFGALTFFIPLGLGAFVCNYLLGLNPTASLLLASMLATHTLVSFPIVSRLGLTRNDVVTIAVGGTILADMAVLLVLALVTASEQEHGLTFDTLLTLLLKVGAFGAAVLLGFPRIAKWFFRSLEAGGGAQYLFVLLMVFAASFLAELAGVEPIIGAFLAGLALNPLIPHSSALMGRIEFIGNTLFIPFFLLSVGMLIDISVLFTGTGIVVFVIVLTMTAILSKWLAARMTGWLLKFSRPQTQVLVGLTSARAAATLAVVLVGYDLKLFGDDILNAVIILILLTCLISSFITEAGARQLALAARPSLDQGTVWERILIPVADPQHIARLMDFAIILKEHASPEPLFPLAVFADDEQTEQKIIQHQDIVRKVVKNLSPVEQVPLQHVCRMSLHVPSGITRASRELLITDILMGWSGEVSTRQMLFGSTVNGVVGRFSKTVWVSKLLYPLNTMAKLVIVAPANAEREAGFRHWLEKTVALAKTLSAEIRFFAPEPTLAAIDAYLKETKSSVNAATHAFDDWADFLVLAREVGIDDLFVVVAARDKTLSYDSAMENMARNLSKHFTQVSFVVVYPEQSVPGKETYEVV